MRKDFTCYTWLYVLQHKSDTRAKFQELLWDVRGDGNVECMRTNLCSVCIYHCIEKTFTTVDNLQLNGVAERGLGIIASTATAGWTEFSIFFLGAYISSVKTLWAEPMLLTYDSIVRSASTGNPDRTAIRVVARK